MILEKEIEITINSRNKFLYPLDSIGDKKIVNYKELSKGSKVKVLCKCDNCGIKKEICYFQYINCTKDEKIEYYCNKCSYIHSNNTNIEKYGVKNVMFIDSIKEKHLDSVHKIDYDEANKKREITNLEKYGFKVPTMNDSIKDKIKETTMVNHGVEYIFNLPLNRKNSLKASNSKESIQKKKLTKYPKYIKKLSERYKVNILDFDGEEYSILCDKNHIYKTSAFNLNNREDVAEQCTICNPIGSLNGSENEIKELLNLLNIDFIEKDRTFGFEMDFFIPSKNIAIEFNGIYWHSHIFRDEFYHKNKYDVLKENNIQLITIWENSWIEDKNTIKNIIEYIINENKINDFIVVKDNLKYKINDTIFTKNDSHYLVNKFTINFYENIEYFHKNISKNIVMEHDLCFLNTSKLINIEKIEYTNPYIETYKTYKYWNLGKERIYLN